MINRNQVKGLQSLLNTRIQAGLVVDGVYGPKTASAMAKLPASDRQLVEAVLLALGIRVPAVISRALLEELAERLSAETGVPLSYLKLCLRLENGDADHYVVDMEGRYQGFGQFDMVTWIKCVPKEARNMRGTPYWDIKAICQLYMLNKATFENVFKDREYTDQIAYLYHNQGAGGAEQYIRSRRLRYPQQSKAALLVFREALNNDTSSSQSIIA